MKNTKVETSILKYFGKAVLIALLVVFVIRSFVFETYTISTRQMESALLEGDEVVVSKLSYGPRLPITLLSIPFTFDEIFGYYSYSDKVLMPYKRLFSSPILCNDIVLFNSPIETDKPLDKGSLMISRCVAVPNDTIQIRDGVYYINNKQYVQSPTLVSEYTTPYSNYEIVRVMSDKLGLTMEGTRYTADSIYFSMDRYSAFILNKNTPKNTFYLKQNIIPETLIFIVPSKGRGVVLSPKQIKIYRKVIEYEQGSRAEFKGDELYIDGEKVDIYTFNDDYYWMLSDNSIESVDSRTLGFIPYRNVVGRITSILYSRYKGGFDPDRFFIPVQ